MTVPRRRDMSANSNDPPVPTTALVRRLGRQLASAYEDGLTDAGYSDLTVAQTTMLPLIGAKGARITGVAALAGVTKQAVALLVDQLEAAGYVERVPDPLDARAKVVRLTESGWAALRTVQLVLDDIDRKWADTLGEHRHQQLRKALHTLLDQASAPDPLTS
jgi:DNA-binding MarR family transcriptional regulator